MNNYNDRKMTPVEYRRRVKGISQAKLCTMVKTSQRKIIEIERGNYDLVTISLGKRIAKALDTTFENLFLKEN